MRSLPNGIHHKSLSKKVWRNYWWNRPNVLNKKDASQLNSFVSLIGSYFFTFLLLFFITHTHTLIHSLTHTRTHKHTHTHTHTHTPTQTHLYTRKHSLIERLNEQDKSRKKVIICFRRTKKKSNKMSKHYQFIAVRREVDQDVIVVVVKATDAFVLRLMMGHSSPF